MWVVLERREADLLRDQRPCGTCPDQRILSRDLRHVAVLSASGDFEWTGPRTTDSPTISRAQMVIGPFLQHHISHATEAERIQAESPTCYCGRCSIALAHFIERRAEFGKTLRMGFETANSNHLLFIDDEVGITSVIEHVARALGFQVLSIHDSGHFEQAFTKIQPDVIFLDIAMPGRDGMQLIGHSAARGYKGQIVIMSGSGTGTFR